MNDCSDQRRIGNLSLALGSTPDELPSQSDVGCDRARTPARFEDRRASLSVEVLAPLEEVSGSSARFARAACPGSTSKGVHGIRGQCGRHGMCCSAADLSVRRIAGVRPLLV